MSPIELVGAEWLGSLALFLAFILLIRYLDHRERMAMIARGLVPVPDGRQRARRGGSAALRGGMITAMVGLAVTFALYQIGYLLPPPFNAVPGGFGPWLLPGLIPLGVGLALIASHYMATSPELTASAPPNHGGVETSEPRGHDVPTHESEGGRPPRSAGGPATRWRVLGGDATAHEPESESD
jgi:hypothetical protein